MTIQQNPTTIRSGAFLITPSNTVDLPNVAVGLLIGETGGNVRILTPDGDDVTIPVNTHQFLQVQARRVFATGTTATTIHGLR